MRGTQTKSVGRRVESDEDETTKTIMTRAYGEAGR